MSFEDLTLKDLQKHALLLSNFSKNRLLFEPKDILKAIETLCSNYTELSYVYVNEHICVFCGQTISHSQIVRMSCDHEVHKVCIEDKAKRISNGTMDPEKLKEIVCGKCEQGVSVQCIMSVVKGEDEEKVDVQESQRVQMAQKPKEQIPIKEMKNLKLSQPTKLRCGLCDRQHPVQNIITLSCSDDHRLCKQCLKQCIKKAMSKSKIVEKDDLFCPLMKCQGKIDDAIIKDQLNQEDYSILKSKRQVKPKSGFKDYATWK